MGRKQRDTEAADPQNRLAALPDRFLRLTLPDSAICDHVARALAAWKGIDPELRGGLLVRLGVDQEARPRYSVATGIAGDLFQLGGGNVRRIADILTGIAGSSIGTEGPGSFLEILDRDAMQQWLAERVPPSEAAGTARRAATPDARDQPAIPPNFRDWQQWNLECVNAASAWRTFLALVSGNAAGTILATPIFHLDTGFSEHPAFGFSLGSGSSPLDVAASRSFLKGAAPSALDPLGYDGFPGHGTRTCSVLCGEDHQNGFIPLLPEARVIPFRVTETILVDLVSSNPPIARAVSAAVDAGAKVISISLGHVCGVGEAVRDAFKKAYDNGVIVVCASGNIIEEVVFPARLAWTICAGGVARSRRPDGTDRYVPWQGASRGPEVDIAAPADEIARANVEFVAKDRCLFTYGRSGDGTSYATVHVAGAAALWLALNGPQLIAQFGGDRWKLVESFRNSVRRYCRRPADWPVHAFGAGILDMHALIANPPVVDGLARRTKPWRGT